MSPQTGLWFRCRIDFLGHQPRQVTLWWDWWLSKTPCCKKKFAKTNKQSDSRLSGYLNVCKEEMSKIKFFGISKETIDEVHKSLEEWFSRGNTVPGTQSSHHFIPLSSSKIAHKLSSKDESHAGAHEFNLPTTFQLCDIRPVTYVTYLYDSFWWVRLVTQVDVKQGDVKVQFMFPHGACKTFNWPETEDSCYAPTKNILCQILLPQQLDKPIKIW